jgi:hypothetical protein
MSGKLEFLAGGYATMFLLMTFFVGSLYKRYRDLRRDLTLLKHLMQDQDGEEN